MDEIRGKSIFLTGGAGFIGASLAQALLEHNRVVVYDNDHRNALRDSPAWTHPNLFYINGDALDADKLHSAVERAEPQMVVCLAEFADVDIALEVPVRTMKINFIGAYNMLEAVVAHAKNLERFVDFSTSDLFGTQVYHAEGMSSTNLSPIGEARWTSAVSKLAAEQLVYNYGKECGLPTVSIRPFNIFGPRQTGVGAIHTFIFRALKGLPLEIHGDGAQIRAWLYIDDMVDGIIATLTRPEAVGHVFNIGDPGGAIKIHELAEKIRTLCESESEIIFVDKDYNDIELKIPSVEKAAELLDFKAKVGLDEGLIRTINWYRDQMETGRGIGEARQGKADASLATRPRPT